MVEKVLIANRGEIALRIVRSCRELGIATVAVFSTVDKKALHVQLADEAVCVGDSLSNKSYLNIPNILAAATSRGVDAIHPGYGFLAENDKFAEMCNDHGIVFIGPSPKAIRSMGDKSTAKETMEAVGVPTVPGSKGLFTKESTDAYGLAIGYETDTYGFTAAYSDKDTASYYGLVAYYSPEELPTTFSGGFEAGTPDSGSDTTQWAFGISTELGEGTLSANIGTNGKIAENAEEIYAYDLSYEYPINDSMSITPFVYISETTGTTVDTTGAGAFVSFSF